MKLNTKITISLVLGLSSIMALAQTFQYLDQTRRITKQTQTEIQALEAQAERNARSIYDSVQMAGSLEQGEMEKFKMMLQKQKNVPGLVEYSLYDRKGTVTHSSHAEFLGKTMAQEQKQALFSQLSEKVIKTDASIEIYKPVAITGDCIRCHMDWPGKGIGGVTYFKYSTKELADAKAGAEAMLAQIETAMLRNGLLALAGLAVVIYILSNKLVGRPLKTFFAMLKPLETDSKNLTYQIPVDRNDEIGTMAQTFNLFTGNLNGVIGEAQEIGKRVGTEAARQADMVDKTNSQMHELSTQTKHNSDNAQKANHLMNEISQQMNDANQAMHSLSITMTEISQASSKTASIVKTIDGIASQTNLLALNAAVEAARAGEAGKGFSVVAEAVRKLAKGCAEAARNIGHLIDDTVNKVQKGEQFVTATSKRFEQLAQQNNSATQLIDEIAVSSEQQSQAIDTVNTALSELDHSTQQNATEAEQLMQAMEQFKTDQNQFADERDDSAGQSTHRVVGQRQEAPCMEIV
jgi:methyl-accepting chemotaxis protein